MKARIFLSLVISIALAGVLSTAVQADGIIVPDPPICDPVPCPVPPRPRPMEALTIRYHHVTVKIENQIAVTHIDQVFYNPDSWEVEGEYIFPLPQGAAISNFTLWIDGLPVKGEVLDAQQAREKYEEVVRSLRDPALLEYASRGAVSAHIYPIPSDGERRIELEYSQALTAENGLIRYVYPLNTEKFSTEPIESVSVSVQIQSDQPIRAVYSPTHTVSVNRQDENHVTAGYEANNVRPDTDFALYYSIGESEAFHLLTYRDPTDPTDPDGFFLLLMAPRPEQPPETVAKDVLLVLDHSGSMDGEKFRQAQEALRFVLRHLNPGDRFDVISFSTAIETYASELRSTEDVPEALAWVDQLSASGSTDIQRALLEAASLARSERPTYLIFLTDGLPTEGVTDSQQILTDFARAASPNLRLFAFGVGYDVDTVLLDSLAQDHHGTTTYVRPGEPLDEILSSFYAKISTPVLTDLKLEFGSLAVYDIYPNPLPDLFLGSQIIATGRYREGGTFDINLSGQVNGQTQTFHYPEQVFAKETSEAENGLASLPRLWATRKIGYLLNKIRLEGADQETVDQIVRLSIRYGIVTPYTSYLVNEPMPLGADAQNRIARDQFSQLQAAPTQAASGQAAVEKAAGLGGMAQAEAPAALVDPAAPGDSSSTNPVRIVGSRTFVLQDEVWVDTAYDPKTMKTTPVAFLSPGYFALAESRPDIASVLALGQRVIVVAGQVVYEVVEAGTTTQPIQIPTSLAPTQKSLTTPTASVPEPAGDTRTTVQPAGRTPFNNILGTICLAGLIPAGVVFFILRKLRSR